jgi:hypothetical protein
MKNTDWKSVYEIEIETRREHNQHFTLEEFLSYSDEEKFRIRYEYSRTSLLNMIRGEMKTFFYMETDPIKECNKNGCEIVYEFLKNE